MLQYDDQDAPEDTIIHDLTISNVRPHHHTAYLPPTVSLSLLIPDPHLEPSTHTFLRVTYPESSLAL